MHFPIAVLLVPLTGSPNYLGTVILSDLLNTGGTAENGHSRMSATRSTITPEELNAELPSIE